MSAPTRHFYEFGSFRLDPQKHRLFRDGELVAVSPKAIDTLILLVQNSGKLLEREALMQAVWADTFVEDANLTVAISQLRKALGQGSDNSEYIETVPRAGYRFAGEVREVTEKAAPLIIEKHSVSLTMIEEELSDLAPEVKQQTISVPQIAPWFSSRNHVRIGLIAFVIVASALGSFTYFKGRKSAAEKRPSIAAIRSIAVLPPKSLNNPGADAPLNLGIADALISKLGRIHGLVIRPTSAVARYADSDQDQLKVGRALGVDAVLEGTSQRDQGRLRVNLRLLETSSGTQLWTGSFDEVETDVFKLQDSVSQEVTQALSLDLSQAEKLSLTKRPTQNLDAYQAYIKGRYFWNKRTGAGLQQSVQYFKQAIDIDPAYAAAYAGLADSYALLAWQDEIPQTQFIPIAKAAAVRALEMDETLAEAHASLGFVKFWYYWDFPGAETEYRRAIELDPNYATAHHWYDELLVLTGRFDEGLKETTVAQQLDPLSLVINADLGKFLFFARRPDQAIEQLKKPQAFEPEFPQVHLFLAFSYNQKGMTEEAIAELQKVANQSSRTIFKSALAYVYARSGHKAEAMNLLTMLQQPSSQRMAPPYEIALIYAGLGQSDQALAWLEKARQNHDPFLLYGNVDPNFDSIRSDPRFATVVSPVPH